MARRHRKKLVIDNVSINVLPLIGILMVIVVFFAIFGFRRTEVALDHQAITFDDEWIWSCIEGNALVVTIRGNGDIWLGGAIRDLDDVELAAIKLRAQKGTTEAIIRLEDTVEAGHYVDVIDTLKEAGIDNIAYMQIN